MGWWTKVDTRIWGDARFRGLPEEVKLLWLFLLTSPAHRVPGLVCTGRGAIQDTLDIDLEGAIARLEEEGMILKDWQAQVIYLPNALKYHRPQNPNQLQNWLDTYDSVPECALKDRWYSQLVSLAQSLGNGYANKVETVSGTVQESFPEPFANGIGNNRIEKNRKEKREEELVPFGDIVALLNELTGSRYRSETPATRRLIKARWSEGFRLEDFKEVIRKQCKAWKGDEKMEQYLRPQTLFGTKFEGYLQSQQGKNLLDEWEETT